MTIPTPVKLDREGINQRLLFGVGEDDLMHDRIRIENGAYPGFYRMIATGPSIQEALKLTGALLNGFIDVMNVTVTTEIPVGASLFAKKPAEKPVYSIH